MGSALVLSLSGADRADSTGLAAGPTASLSTVTRSSSSAITSVTAASMIATRRRAGTWQLLASSPLAVLPERGDYREHGLWTGKEMLRLKLVFPDPKKPDRRMSVEGAAYNPATRTWRRLPTLYALKKGILAGDIRVAWTGSEALVAGLINGAYNPATNRWRPIATPNDAELGEAIPVWTGRQLLVWRHDSRFLAYTPSSDTWSVLPPSPLVGVKRADGVWTGKELIVVGDTEVNAPAAAYNPTTRSWRRLAPMLTPRTDATFTWTGKEVLVVGGSVRNQPGACACALAYDPATNRWRSLPDMEVGRQEHVAAWTGSLLLVWGAETVLGNGHNTYVAPSHGAVFDPARNRWSPMPKWPLRDRKYPTALWTGSKLIIWGGVTFEDYPKPLNDGAAYIPWARSPYRERWEVSEGR